MHAESSFTFIRVKVAAPVLPGRCELIRHAPFFLFLFDPFQARQSFPPGYFVLGELFASRRVSSLLFSLLVHDGADCIRVQLLFFSLRVKWIVYQVQETYRGIKSWVCRIAFLAWILYAGDVGYRCFKVESLNGEGRLGRDGARWLC